MFDGTSRAALMKPAEGRYSALNKTSVTTSPLHVIVVRIDVRPPSAALKVVVVDVFVPAVGQVTLSTIGSSVTFATGTSTNTAAGEVELDALLEMPPDVVTR